MFEVEGGTEAECMRILRHEAGHAIDTAYGLHFKRRWRELFGSFAQPYPRSYKPRPKSRNHVLHLGAWYAQAHPAEDFAETFAVWLAPRSRWRTRYRTWPALKKLEYVDEQMDEIKGQPPRDGRRDKIEPLAELPITLRSIIVASARSMRSTGALTTTATCAASSRKTPTNCRTPQPPALYAACGAKCAR